MIAVIILNWNNAPDTIECLQSVYRSDDPNFSVFVVDNGSKDDSLSIIKHAYPQANYIENRDNLGFAEGNNVAIVKAMNQGAKYLFLLNNDATIAPQTLSTLRQAADSHLNAAALGPKIYYYDSPMTISNGKGDFDPERAIFFSHDRDVDESNTLSKEIEPCCYLIGCALFVRASILDKVKLMDPRFFLNWEEIDWCSQMQKCGYQCLFVPTAKAWHKISRSFVGGKRGAMWHYFFYRNRLLWMEKNLSKKERLQIAKNILWPELKIMIREAFGNEPQNAKASLKGTFDYLIRRFGMGSYHNLLRSKK